MQLKSLIEDLVEAMKRRLEYPRSCNNLYGVADIKTQNAVIDVEMWDTGAKVSVYNSTDRELPNLEEFIEARIPQWQTLQKDEFKYPSNQTFEYTNQTY